MAIITLFDIDEEAASRWAIEHCPSFCGWLIYDNDDPWVFVNLDDVEWKIRYEFEFADDHEAMMFQLRWQGQ